MKTGFNKEGAEGALEILRLGIELAWPLIPIFLTISNIKCAYGHCEIPTMLLGASLLLYIVYIFVAWAEFNICKTRFDDNKRALLKKSLLGKIIVLPLFFVVFSWALGPFVLVFTGALGMVISYIVFILIIFSV